MTVTKKRNFMIILIFVSLVSLSFLTYEKQKVHESKSSLSQVDKELSLKEAVEVAIPKAKEWNKSATIVRITSVDEKMNGTRGSKGKRYKWTLQFTAPRIGKILLIGISNGVVTESRAFEGPNTIDSIDLKDIKFDSPELLKRSIEEYSLRPGVDWATGYHFVLAFYDGIPTITVVGTDKLGQFTKIYFDARDGHETDALHSVPSGGGVIRINQGNSNQEMVGSAVKGISSSENSLVIWGDQSPREFNSAIQPFVKTSSDNGESWVPVSFDQNVRDAWFSQGNMLLAATENEVFLNIGGKDNRKKLLSLNSDIDSMDHTSNGHIVILANHFIYTTSDNGVHWQKNAEPELTKTVQISPAGREIILTRNRKIFYTSGGSWIELEIPESVSPKMIQYVNNNLFITDGYILMVYSFTKREWTKIPVNEQITSLLKNDMNVYVVSGNQNVSVILGGGDDPDKWLIHKIASVESGLVSDVLVSKGKVLVSTVPNYLWKKINMG